MSRMKVYPEEVEAVINRHPGECRSFGPGKIPLRSLVAADVGFEEDRSEV